MGQVGTPELAVANVVINLTLVCILPGIALGLAAATLAGQALGRKDVDSAEQWGWDVTKVGILILVTLGLPMILFPSGLLSFFVGNHATLALGVWPLRIVGLSIAIEGFALVLLNALVALGDSKRVMLYSTFLQWVVFLPIAYLVGPVLGAGLFGIWLVQVIYRGILAVVMCRLWKGRKWATF